MASHSPAVGDLALVHLRERIAIGIKGMFADEDIAQVAVTRGPITAKILQGFSAKTPGVLVSYEGVGTVSSNGTTLTIPAMVCLAVVTKPTKGKTDDQCCAIATRIIRKSVNNKWGTTGDTASAPSGMRAHNLYNAESGSLGTDIWAITWRQDLTIPVMTEAEHDERPPLVIVFSTYTGETPTTPPMITASTFEDDPPEP